MPERLAYDEAMRFAHIRLQINDPEISQGAVETITVSTKMGQIVQPWGVEGGFAVVYKFRTRSGKFRALRCFRREMDPDTQFRYEHIGPYFQAHITHITAGFKYHPQGILIKEPSAPPQGKIYPVIEMEWIEGTTLLDTVDELCLRRDQEGLRDLGQRWLSLLKHMQRAHIAHGDLAGGNVMVRHDGSLVLIDYDGVYIPDFTTHNLRQMLLGQPDYQHPQMSKRLFNEHADAFSAL
ncbi:MAG TPA: AarF/UbiB family protein, partial [Ktedonobacteraceae bacterium]